MSNCPDKFPLSWLKEQADQDVRFAAESLALLERKRSFFRGSGAREAYTLATAGGALIGHWMRENDLRGYVRGNPVDVAALGVIGPLESLEESIANLEDSIIIHRDELVSLLEREGMTVPCYLLASSARSSQIDWAFWTSMKKAEDWQACALSLNIDPDSLERHPQGWMAGPDAGPVFTSGSFSSKEAEEKFGKRLRLLRANRYDRAVFTLPLSKYSNLGPNEVLLSEFAAWAMSISWSDMPSELAALASQTNIPPVWPAPQPLPVISAAEWDALVENEDAARQDPEYKAKYDYAASLYVERDKLLECSRQGISLDSHARQRLSEINQEIARLEAGLEPAPVIDLIERQASVASETKPTTFISRINEERTSSKYQDAVSKRRKPNGGDILTPMIWEICYELQEKGGKVTPIPVMAELKLRAESEDPKFKGPLLSSIAGGVKYEDADGNEKELTNTRLQARINEWKKANFIDQP